MRWSVKQMNNSWWTTTPESSFL